MKATSLYTCLLITALFAVSCNTKETKDNKSAKTEEHKHTMYTCPMHPEVTGKEGEKCPKCGMALQPVKATAEERYVMQLTSSTQNIEAGLPTTLSFIPKNKDNDQAKVELEVQHEKEFHLIVVSEDLSWFNHIHPAHQPDSSYTVSETFPNGGNYLLFADYKPKGSSPQVERIPVAVKGNAKSAVHWSEPKLTSTVDGYTVKLANGNDLKTNVEQHIDISIEKAGKQLKGADLQKYLGANAHIITIGVDDKEFLHIHPESTEQFPVQGLTTFSKPGMYRMWVQFQINGKLQTADFAVKVEQGFAEDKSERQEDHSQHSH